MTWRDKLELGVKEDALHGKDNLPPSQIRGPELLDPRNGPACTCGAVAFTVAGAGCCSK